jgi:hypothetical protein
MQAPVTRAKDEWKQRLDNYSSYIVLCKNSFLFFQKKKIDVRQPRYLQKKRLCMAYLTVRKIGMPIFRLINYSFDELLVTKNVRKILTT